jgi:alpha-D-ribose 1-methylphosphonate 5-triphosphate synthase subunit PhnH
MGAAVRFDDPARRSQAVFRAVMTAMSRPGRIERIKVSDEKSPLPGCMAELAFALCDFETPVWTDLALDSAQVHEWFRFQTGAPFVEEPARASFAFVADAAAFPRLGDFALGNDEYPDRSTTLVIAVERMSDQRGLSLVGPGVNGSAKLDVGPLRSGLFEERANLRELFPRGVDLIFVCGDRIVALPRTTVVGD